MPASYEDLVARLDAISEELGDLAFDVLREAAADGADRAPSEEKRLTRARRAVEKAAGLLRDPGAGVDDGA